MQRKGFLINKAFNKYLLASILTVAAMQIAAIVDASIVGNIIGPEGLASVVVNDPVIQAIYAISCLFVPSCTMLAGMAIGNGDKQKANTLYSFCIIVCVVLGGILTVAGLFGMDSLAVVLCQSDTLRPMVKDYMMVTILTVVPMLFMLTLQQFVAIDGSPKTVTVSVIVGAVLNLTLDIVFMKYCGWGIAGAAWATFISNIVPSLMLLLYLRRYGTLRLCAFSFSSSCFSVKEIFTFGIPLFLSIALVSVQITSFNNIASTYMGNYGLVALAVCMQLWTLAEIILTGTLRTVQPVGAILSGIGDFTGMRMLLLRAYRFMAVCLVFFVVVFVFFPTQFAALLGVTEPEAMPFIRQALPAFALNLVMQALLYILMPVYQFYNQHRMALLLSLGQPLLTIAGFWALAFLSTTDFQLSTFNFQQINPWYGFFVGQLVAAVILLISAALVRRRHKNLTPIVLIPRTEYPTLEMSFGYSEDDMHSAFDEVTTWLRQQSLTDSVVFKVRIIAEELMSNITHHSQQKNKSAYVDVRIVVNPDNVTFALTDNGIPFNPIENKDKGYGLMIANGAANDINYNYQFGQNMTTVKVNINQ